MTVFIFIKIFRENKNILNNIGTLLSYIFYS